MIKNKLEEYQLSFQPRVTFIDLMQIIQRYKPELGFRRNDKLSMATIFEKLSGRNKSQDVFQNALGLRLCSIEAAKRLNMSVEEFLILLMR